MSVCAIIAAAGRGQRMGSPINKQFLPIENKPIIVHTLEKFSHCDLIASIIIVVPEGWFCYTAEEIIDKYDISKVSKIVIGGTTRQESVFAALKAVEINFKTVVIHDAVRPLIHTELLRKVIATGIETGAAVLAIPVRESIKKVSNSQVEFSLNRESIWIAQTPQVFNRDLLLTAHQQAILKKMKATDDSELVEQIGVPVHVVEGSHINIKITTPDDLELVKLLITKVK